MLEQPSAWLWLQRARKRLTSSPWLLIGAVTLMVHLPWIIPWLRTPPTAVYTGYVGGGDDYWSYLTKLRQGWDGHWRWQNLYNPTGSASWFLYPFYLLIGHVTRWLGGDFTQLPLAFHVAALILTPPVLWLIWRMAVRVVPDAHTRPWSLMLAFAGTAGTTLLLMVQKQITTIHMLDLYPAPHPFIASLLYPHYLVNLAGMLGAFHLFLRFRDTPRWWQPLVGTVCFAGVSMVHPHIAALTAVVMGVYALTLPGQARWRSLVYTVVAAAGALPYGLYLLAVIRHPELSAWRSAAVQGPPTWYFQPFWAGLAVPLAVLAFPEAYRDGGASRLMALWLTIAYVLSNAHLPLTAGGGELLMGLSIPAGLLTGRFLSRRSHLWRDLVGIVTVAGALYLVASFTVDGVDAPEFGPTSTQVYIERTAITGLERDASVRDGAVLAPVGTMVKIPWLVGTHVVYGHTVETPGGRSTRETAVALCTNTIEPAQRTRLVETYRITDVVTDPDGTGAPDSPGCVPPRKD